MYHGMVIGQSWRRRRRSEVSTSTCLAAPDTDLILSCAQMGSAAPDRPENNLISHEHTNDPYIQFHTNIKYNSLQNIKQPIRTRYLGHITGYQPIRGQYLLIRSVPDPSAE
eukprot:sb/3477167/